MLVEESVVLTGVSNDPVSARSQALRRAVEQLAVQHGDGLATLHVGSTGSITEDRRSPPTNSRKCSIDVPPTSPDDVLAAQRRHRRRSSRRDVIAWIARDAAETLESPHVVHVNDPFLDAPLVVGPFESPVAASVFAEIYRTELVYAGCDDPPTITVMPLRHP